MTSVEDDFSEYAAGKIQWLRSVAYLLCLDWQRADDLGQVAITKLYAKWRHASKVENLDGYVRTILVNAFLHEHRTAWWKRATLTDQEPSAAVVASDIESLLDLRDVLKSLPPRRRAAVVLRFYEELSVHETAEVLGCSAGTVESETAHALDVLQPKLAQRTQIAPLTPAGPSNLLPPAKAPLAQPEGAHPWTI